VRELDWWQEVRIPNTRGELFLAAVPAQHFSARGLGDRGKTLWCSWVIGANGFRAFFAGDTAFHPEFAEIGRRYGPYDLLMIPVGAYEPRWFMHTVHMNPPEALRAYVELSARNSVAPVMLPIHWGTFRLTDESMHEPTEWTDRLWREAAYDRERLWLVRHGETRTLRRT
jgi:N-acyl-phosphatidylethanolamine-hydrolysing phospholipase D